MNKTRSSHMPLVRPPVGKHMLPTRDVAMSGLETRIMQGLDAEKLSDLAEVLYAFNNYRVGPMPGFFVAVEVTPGEAWCVGQLCADREKPLKLFDKKIYKTARGAQKAAERMRAKDLEALTG
jgi:hypothetical protein